MSNIIYTFSSDRCCWISKIPEGYKIDTPPGDDLIRVAGSSDSNMDCLTEFTDDYVQKSNSEQYICSLCNSQLHDEIYAPHFYCGRCEVDVEGVKINANNS